MAKILDGKIIRDKIAGELKAKIQNLLPAPRLVIIQVGDNPESNTYIAQKIKFGERIGANVKLVKLPEDVTEKTFQFQISTFNSERSVHGIIVQMPIAKNLDKDSIIEMIDSEKDVDGQTAVNIKKLIENDQAGFVPATTKGILTMLEYYKIPVSGKHVVVIGRSSLVGKPTALALLNKDATVTICHSKTKDLANVTKSADILIVAAGNPRLITQDYVSPNQTVIDVGINVLPSSRSDLETTERSDLLKRPESEPTGRKLIGDVDFESVSIIVKAISPVPGGIGPLTVASLFENLLDAYIHQNSLNKRI